MNPGDVVGFGMQGTEMLRGTGATNAQGFNMALEARLQTERLQMADPTTRQLIVQAGGPNRFAMSQMQTAAGWMQGGQGMMAMTGLLGGMQGLPNNMTEMLQGSANFYSSDPLNMFRFQSRQGQLNASLGFNNQQAMMVGTAYRMVDQLGLTGPNGKIDEDALVGVMMNPRGMNLSAQQARAAIAGVRDLSRNSAAARKADETVSAILSASRESQTGIWDTITGATSYAFSKVFTDNALARGTGAGLTDLFSVLKDTGEDIGDSLIGRERWRSTVSARRSRDAQQFIGSEKFREIMKTPGTRNISEIAAQKAADFKSEYWTPYSTLIDRGYTKEFLDKSIGGLGSDDLKKEFLYDLYNNGDLNQEELEEYMSIGVIGSDYGNKERDLVNDLRWKKGTSFIDQANGLASQILGREATMSDLNPKQRAALIDKAKNIGLELDEDILRQANIASTSRQSLEQSNRAYGLGDYADRLEGEVDDMIVEMGIVKGVTDDFGNTGPKADVDGIKEAIKYFAGGGSIGELKSMNPADVTERFGPNMDLKRLKAVKGRVEDTAGISEVEKKVIKAQGYEDAEAFVDAASGSLASALSNDSELFRKLKNSPSMMVALTKRLAEKSGKGKDFLWSDGMSKEELEDLGVEEELKDIAQLKSSNYNAEISGIVSNITRGNMTEALKEGNMALFQENADKYVRQKVMEGLGHIITPDGLMTVSGDSYKKRDTLINKSDN